MAKLLPKDFRSSHDFAFFLYREVANTVVFGEKAQIFRSEFILKSESEAEVFKRLSGEELLTWLQENGYGDVYLDIAYRQMMVALLADFCNFVYEALSCSEKGKLTVSYALLRKPFKENLFYLEWLLADPGDLISKFCFEPPSTLALSNSVSKERKIEIIKGAMEKTHHPDWISHQFLYDLRYTKAIDYGLESIWNKAIHLVTTFKAFPTESQNLNFVFSNADSLLDQWRRFYLLVPILLNHAVEIVESLIDTIAYRKKPDSGMMNARRIAGFILWAANQTRLNSKESLPINPTKDLFNGLNLKCTNCKRVVRFGIRNLRSFYQRGIVKCGYCRTSIDPSRTDV